MKEPINEDFKNINSVNTKRLIMNVKNCIYKDRVCKEDACNRFCTLMLDDYDFASTVKCELYSHAALWREKEFGRDDEEEMVRIFDLLWDYDCVELWLDCKRTALKYIDNIGVR